MHIVWNEPAILQFFLHHRMAAILENVLPILGDHRLAEIVIHRRLPQRKQAVNLRNAVRCVQNPCYVGAHRIAQLHKELILQLLHLFICAQHSVFQLFQLRCDKPLTVGQRLLPHIFLGHIAAFAPCDVNIIAEHFVVTHFQRPNAGAFPLSLLQIYQPLLAVDQHIPQCVNLLVVTIANEVALPHRKGRLGMHGSLQ